MKKKNFKLGNGKYYFNLQSGHQSILIMRAEKQDAINAFISYRETGKSCEWLGCWNGKTFSETTVPSSSAA